MSNGARILIVDDDPDMLHLLGVRLAAAGYLVAEADSGEAALESFRAHRPQLVITDLCMDGMDGLALFDHLQRNSPTLPVIILTAHGTIPDAVSATRRGVFSFLTKPFDGQELLRRVADAMRLSPSLDQSLDDAAWRRDLIANDIAMEELLRQALRISQEEQNCLIVGPSGSGKSALARAMHRGGPRRERPFLEISCTDFPGDALEAKLATDNPDCIFDQIEGGVLHIRDIGALSPMAQSRLFALLFARMQARNPLQALNSTVNRKKTPNIQVFASTPRPLDTAIAENSFRSDLFFLLGSATLLIPPLAERSGDILPLASHFLAQLRPDAPLTLAPEALLALQEGSWPGNVTELRNVLEQVAKLSITPVVPEAIVRRVMRDFEADNLPALDDARRDFEREYLVRLLQTTHGNVARAARVAQRNRTEFYKLLARHGLDPASFKQKFR